MHSDSGLEAKDLVIFIFNQRFSSRRRQDVGERRSSSFRFGLSEPSWCRYRLKLHWFDLLSIFCCIQQIERMEFEPM